MQILMKKLRENIANSVKRSQKYIASFITKFQNLKVNFYNLLLKNFANFHKWSQGKKKSWISSIDLWEKYEFWQMVFEENCEMILEKKLNYISWSQISSNSFGKSHKFCETITEKTQILVSQFRKIIANFFKRLQKCIAFCKTIMKSHGKFCKKIMKSHSKFCQKIVKSFIEFCQNVMKSQWILPMYL